MSTTTLHRSVTANQLARRIDELVRERVALEYGDHGAFEPVRTFRGFGTTDGRSLTLEEEYECSIEKSIHDLDDLIERAREELQALHATRPLAAHALAYPPTPDGARARAHRAAPSRRAVPSSGDDPPGPESLRLEGGTCVEFDRWRRGEAVNYWSLLRFGAGMLQAGATRTYVREVMRDLCVVHEVEHDSLRCLLLNFGERWRSGPATRKLVRPPRNTNRRRIVAHPAQRKPTASRIEHPDSQHSPARRAVEAIRATNKMRLALAKKRGAK